MASTLALTFGASNVSTAVLRHGRWPVLTRKSPKQLKPRVQGAARVSAHREASGSLALWDRAQGSQVVTVLSSSTSLSKDPEVHGPPKVCESGTLSSASLEANMCHRSRSGTRNPF